MATSLTLQNDPSLPQGYLKVNGTTAATVTENGLSIPQATIGSLNGILKATSGVVSQAVDGTDYLTSSSGGSITLATAQTASGTAVNFTGIPSWVKRITVMINGLSTNGTSVIQVQIGDSEGIETTGYNVSGVFFVGSSISTAITNTGFFLYDNAPAATNVMNGSLILSTMGNNIWCGNGSFNDSAQSTLSILGGNKSLSNILTQLRITTVNGTDTFDAGTINIAYEG